MEIFSYNFIIRSAMFRLAFTFPSSNHYVPCNRCLKNERYIHTHTHWRWSRNLSRQMNRVINLGISFDLSLPVKTFSPFFSSRPASRSLPLVLFPTFPGLLGEDVRGKFVFPGRRFNDQLIVGFAIRTLG